MSTLARHTAPTATCNPVNAFDISARDHGTPHTTTGARADKTTETTGLENTMEFVSNSSDDAVGYAVWREMVQWQRDGYAVAGSRPEVKACGTVPVIRSAGGGMVALSTVAGGGVRISGMWRCGSRWCAECRAKVAAHKTAEVKQAVSWALGHGLVVAMYTLTCSHVTVDELATAQGNLHEAVQSVTTGMVRKRVSQAWAKATRGSRGVKLRRGRVGTITAQEVTTDDLMTPGSRSGIHWHRHMLVFLEPVVGVTAQEVAHSHGDLLFSAWSAGVSAVGLVADRQGFDVMVAEDENHAVELAGYVSKGESAPVVPTESVVAGSLADEVARAEGKSGRRGGRVSLEQVLRNIAYLHKQGETKRAKRLTAQWKDLELGTKGVHWLRWSPGLRDLVGLGDELTDEEIANTEDMAAEEPVAVVSWDELREHVEELRRVVRESDEGEEFATLLLCLDSWGIDYNITTAEEWGEMVSARLVAMRGGG